jgi:hypothetical protein
MGDDHKKVKKIAWLSDKLFYQWVQGGDLQSEWPPEKGESNIVQSGAVWLGRDELPLAQGWRDAESDDIAFWAIGDAPRVTVDRVSSASACTRPAVRFQPGGGLWFLAFGATRIGASAARRPWPPWATRAWGASAARARPFRLRRGEAAAPC